MRAPEDQSENQQNSIEQDGRNVLPNPLSADIGRVEGLDKKIIAGHVGTADIAQDDCFHDIYFDGYNHYYIDGTTIVSGIIPILEIDTEMGSYREYLRSH